MWIGWSMCALSCMLVCAKWNKKKWCLVRDCILHVFIRVRFDNMTLAHLHQLPVASSRCQYLLHGNVCGDRVSFVVDFNCWLWLVLLSGHWNNFSEVYDIVMILLKCHSSLVNIMMSLLCKCRDVGIEGCHSKGVLSVVMSVECHWLL